ncbi:hypothetical protein BGZ97_012975 [Linnemannia gamsii]|uniref:Uncharacterized protein n=1 Tax=Linnemannia gamsii TaxID=64522 RepID=A0A9P6R4W0_9FUNG|nr:hypothetical protein BGZ97_012975 [Linnemannia gamsii]
MAALQPVSVFDVLGSIPFAPERPTPHGALAARRWASLLLDILLHPTRWHKLGLAVQWAKWVEWEGGLDLKGPIRTPGVLHLQNPLHPFALNQLLNLLDFSLLDIETLVGCADTGDWTCLFREIDPPNAVTDNAKIREQAAQSLQHLCLLTFYLRQGLCSLTGSGMKADPKERAEDAQIQDLVARILRNDKTTAVAAANGIWYQAFSEQALRLTPQQDPRNSTLPSKLSVILNEVLEAIRMNKLRKDGWTDPAQTDKLTDQQFQQLGKLLSTSFFTIMEFADVSLLLPVENVVMLSQFASQLPASWYSDDFLRTTVRLAKRYILTEQQDKVRVPIQIQGLVAITTLWSFWMRKTGAGDANVLGQELVEVMAQILSIPSFFTGPESKGLFGACFSGLATGLDKWAGLMEPKIVEGLVSGMERGRLSAEDSDMDGVQASLATVLRSNIMNDIPDSIKKLVTSFLQSFYGGISPITLPMAISNVDELFQIQRLFQFVVTQKAGLVAVKDEDDGKKKRKKRKPKKAVVLKGQAWFQALVQGIQEVSALNALPGLLATAGILRAIQHGEDDPPKVDEESLALIQDVFVTQLNGLVDTIKAEDKMWTVSSQTHACLVFATCQTVPNLPACKLEALDRPFLTSLLVDYMLQPNDGVIPVNEIIRVINYELARERNRLITIGPSNALLSRTVRGPLFSEMGRVARTVATLIESMGNKDDGYKGYWGEIENVLQKLHSFAVNLHVDWSRCALSQLDSFIERIEGDRTGGLDAETSKSTGMLFQVFKTLLFAYTMIFGAIVEKSTSDPVPVGVVSHLDYLILDSYAYLFFVTYKLGPGGFQVYEELVTSILTRMVMSEEQASALVRQQPDQDKDEHPNRHILLNKTLKAMMPRAELGFHDPVMESRTLFFMNLLERLMVAINDTLLEEQLLPLVYPYLLKNDQRDLFESAHSVVMSVFLINKRIAQRVAPFYANLLIQHFPAQINIDQLRAAFTTMIRSLSGTEDALAWLCVEKLLERIQQYDDDLADATAVVQVEVERREGEKALVEIATSVQQDLSPQESATHLPSLGTLNPTTTSTRVLSTPQAILECQKERGQLLLALFDQVSSLNLVFVETLGLKIRELLVKEPSPVGRRALLKCLLDVIGGPAVDHTKRDWAVKWYLGLANEFGQKGTSFSSNSSGTGSQAAHAT